MLDQKTLLVDLELPWAIVTLNRPERRNALSVELMRELTATLQELAQDARVRVIILRANGQVFSAGHDLSELVGGDEARYREIFDTCTMMMETIQAIPQPVIAEVAGTATAAGCQLVATCDLAIAAEGSRFATSGVKQGLFCSTPMVAVSRAVGRKRALEMLLTGEFVDAPTAADWGLINRVVPADQLEAATRELAEKIAALSPYAIKVGKHAFYKQIDLPQHAAYEHTREVMVCNTLAADGQEGISAFLEKRRPEWTGR